MLLSNQQVLVHGLCGGKQCPAEHAASILGGNEPSWDSSERCYHPRQSRGERRGRGGESQFAVGEYVSQQGGHSALPRYRDMEHNGSGNPSHPREQKKVGTFEYRHRRSTCFADLAVCSNLTLFVVK